MRKQIQQIYKYILYSLKLQFKLLLSYLLLILIPLTAFTYLSYKNISQSAEQQSKYSANLLLEQTCAFLDYKMSNLEYVTEQIAFDKTLSLILKRDENQPISPELYKDYLDADSILSRLFKPNDMYSLSVYINSNIYYSNNSNNGFNGSYFSNFELLKKEPWYKTLQTFSGKLLWLPPKDIHKQSDNSLTRIISGVRFIKYDLNSNNYENIGIININLLEKDMTEIVKKANTYNSGLAYIMNSEGNIITMSNKNLKDKFNISKIAVTNLINNKNKWETIDINNEKVMLGAQSINETDWVLVSIIPYKEILTSSNKTKNEMIFLMLIIATLAYILAYFISNSITKRIRSLIKRMKKVQNGDLSAIMAVQGKDEMSELVENYNFMMDKMSDYAKLQFESGQVVKSSELKALQAQINPHFLYNTLELIHWIALRKNAPEISDIVQALAKFYKLSLSNGKDIISIKDELAHIEIYVQLQNYRFKDKISMAFDIDERIYSCSILKLLLQPIVENSIVHGILSKPDKTGTIKITGRLEDQIITFTIEDDGIGMTEAQSKEILNSADSQDVHGYGIKNVNHRIKLHYGMHYGLSYHSVLGQGTAVKICIPAIKSDFIIDN